jgi:hypothetical protein
MLPRITSWASYPVLAGQVDPEGWESTGGAGRFVTEGNFFPEYFTICNGSCEPGVESGWVLILKFTSNLGGFAMDGNDTGDRRLARRSYLSGAATLGVLSLGAGSVAAGANDTKMDQNRMDRTGTRKSPARGGAVQPGTSVLFVVESDALGEFGDGTRWFVDGEPEGNSQGPWYSAYYDFHGAECWSFTFESERTHEMTAVIDGNGGIERAS